MTKQDATDLFIQLNCHETVPVLVRMKVRSVSGPNNIKGKPEETENYSQTIMTFDDFLSILDDKEILCITSLVVSLGNTKKSR
jgi:hypothetical protein